MANRNLESSGSMAKGSARRTAGVSMRKVEAGSYAESLPTSQKLEQKSAGRPAVRHAGAKKPSGKGTGPMELVVRTRKSLSEKIVETVVVEAATDRVMSDKKTTKAKSVKVVARLPLELRDRATAIVERSVAFIDSPSFRRKNVEAELFGDKPEPELPHTTWYAPTRDEIADVAASAPTLMTAAEERLNFYRYNFAKHRLVQLQKAAKKDGLTKQLAQDLIEWDRRQEHYREYLTRTNLALVLAMAKRTRLGDIDFAEVVSEGNMALLRAVEKFNVDRGFKFSTYACRAILKAFSRISQKFSKYRTRFPVEFEPDYEKSDWVDKRRDQAQTDVLDELKQIVDRNLADLSTVEQTVIKRRFNWEQQQDTPLTLEEVGKIIGVTKERVRQIQNKALLKIRGVMEDKTERAAVNPADLAELHSA